ncbi:MAG: MBL fold metallo-hydrolase, partial [Deinococcus sp.]
LEALVAASGAEVLTSAAEVPYVQEGRRAQKMPPPERVDELMLHLPPEVREMLKNPPRVQVPVGRVLGDGELLDIAGGVRVIFTPGHTVGHLSLYVEGDGVLISGDALTSAEGQLLPPMERATAEMPEAMRSVTKLTQLPLGGILTYHGGWVGEDAAAQLRQIAEGGATG